MEPINQQQIAQPEQEQTIHLAEYYHLLLRHKWTIALSVVILFVLVLLHNARLVPIYQATATMIIDRESSQSPLTGQRTDYETYLSESLSFNTHFKLITSRPIFERVIDDLKLDRMSTTQKQEGFAAVNAFRQLYAQFKQNIRLLIQSLLPEKEEGPSQPFDMRTALVQMLKGMVQIEHLEETRLLKVHVFSPDPEWAQKVANATARAYINFNVDNRLESSQNNINWLSKQLYEMKRKLEDAEADFQAYKQQVKVVSIDDTKSLITQKLSEFNDAYIEARNKRMELDTKLAQLNRFAKGGSVSHLRSLIDNPLISNLHAQLVNAEVEYSKIAKVFKAKHPKIIQVQSQIQKIRRQLNQEVSKEMANLKAERAVLSSREYALQKTLDDFEAEGMDITRKELKFSILQRNVQMNQQLYDTLLSRIKEADITAGNIDVSNIRITEAAVLPKFPVRPNKRRNLILGIIFGIMIGVGISFLREYIDRTLRTEEDVQKYLGLPVLSVIPLADQAREAGYYSSEPET